MATVWLRFVYTAYEVRLIFLSPVLWGKQAVCHARLACCWVAVGSCWSSWVILGWSRSFSAVMHGDYCFLSMAYLEAEEERKAVTDSDCIEARQQVDAPGRKSTMTGVAPFFLVTLPMGIKFLRTDLCWSGPSPALGKLKVPSRRRPPFPKCRADRG